jgi:hypothetical protein
MLANDLCLPIIFAPFPLLSTRAGLLKCDEEAYVASLLPALVVQCADARSQIVRESCSLITAILPVLGRHPDMVILNPKPYANPKPKLYGDANAKP